MKRLFLKLEKIISGKIHNIQETRKYKRQARNTIKLRAEKISDLERWKKSEELYEDWDERTKILAGLIDSGSRVIEFGAGNMALKAFLPTNCFYTASDIHDRSDEILKCDLNEGINIDLSHFDTAVFSGVLEYVYDVDTVFSILSNSIDNVILSYACDDISNADRLKSGWLSDYNRKDLEFIFSKYRYSVIEYMEWRNQSIFKLRRSKKQL